MGKLDGKVAVITGASSGIGEATAESLAKEGAAVALLARRHDRLVDLAGQITGQLGGAHILVNNAGVMLLGVVEGWDVAQWQRMVDVNILGLLYCTREALPIIRDSGGGHIVNVSSVAGRTANLGSAVYNFTKWGVTGFSEALRQEAMNSGIRVTCVEPGFVDTELQGHNEHPTVQENVEKMREEIGKVLEAEDIARGILYAVAQSDHVNVNEILIRPTGQKR